MPYFIAWDDTEHEVLASCGDLGVLTRYAPDEGDVTWHCLRFLDRWDHTVFNQLQIKWLLVDLERLYAAVEPPADKELISDIIRFVQGAIGEPGTFMRFVGD